MPSKVRIDVRDPSGDSIRNGGQIGTGNEADFEGEIEVNKNGSIKKLKINNRGAGYLGNRVTIIDGGIDKDGKQNPYGGKSLRYIDITITRIQ